MVIIKKTANNKYWQGCGERRPLCSPGGKEISAVCMKTGRRFLKQLKIELPYDSSNSASEYLSERDENTNS